MRTARISFVAIVTVVLVAVGTHSSAWKVDCSTINDASMQLFIEVWPKIKDIAIPPGTDPNTINPLAMGALPSGAQSKTLTLLSKYGVTTQEFSLLMQKVMMGIMQLTMPQGAPQVNMNAFGSLSKPTSEEMRVLQKYLPQLDSTLHSDAIQMPEMPTIQYPQQ
ncbi:hypothetical protein ACFL38_03910 [Candidatus Omnitrophota bacterium]